MKKKFLSVLCTITLIISLCPCFNVSAADVSTITVDDLAGNQVYTAITENLTLPTDGITWSSSNEDVIATDGTVTRPETDVATVTLTADDGVSTKDFTFKVKPMTINVFAQENFNYDAEGDIFASDAVQANGWSNTNSATTSEILTDADGNKYVALDLNDSTVDDVQWDKTATGDKVMLDFDIMENQTNRTNGNSYLTALLNGTNAQGEAVSVEVYLAVFSYGYVYWGYAHNTDDYVRFNTSKRLPATIVMDLENKTITGSLLGGAGAPYSGDSYTEDMIAYSASDAAKLADEQTTFTSISRIRIVSNGVARNIDLDNFVLSAEAKVVQPIDSISADDLAGAQATTAVTGNLTLPEIDGTWSSSNEAVINSTTGKVTRPPVQDKEVTLTATPSDGSTPVTFDFTVRAQNTNILASENFAAYGELTNAEHDTTIFASMTNWANSISTDSHIVKDAKNNNYLEVGFDQTPSDAIRWNISPEERVVYFDVQFKRDTKGMPVNLQTYFSADVNGETAQKVARLATIYDGYVYWGNNASGMYAAYTLGEWHTLSFKIDMDDLKTYGSLDGSEWCEVDMLTSYGGNFNAERDNVSINYMQRIHFALYSDTSTNVMLDNLVLYTKTEEADVDGSLKIKVTGNKKQIDVTSVYDAEHTLTQSFYVRTDTNQHMEYIDQYLTDTNGTKTVLWEKDSYYRSSYPSDESAPLLINYRYFGGNHSTSCALVTSSGHGKTISDVGTMWQAQDGKKWVLAQITDSNRIKFVYAEPLPEGSFELLGSINGGGSGTLTRLENGAATAETFSYTKQSGSQLFPIVKNSQQTVEAYKEDGSVVPVDLSANQSLGAEKVVITDSYDITDPTEVAMSLYNNRPANGYSEDNLPDYAPGETVVAYKQIITIMADGTVLTEFDHEVKQELKMLTYFGIQYHMRNNLGGGVKRLMPGTKAFTATRSTYYHRDSISEDTSSEYGFDFSVPTELYLGTQDDGYGNIFNTFNLPYYKAFKNTDWADTNVVPNRLIDYMYDAGGNSDIAYAAGFLPIDDGAPAERLKNTTTSFDVDGKAKAYPHFINQSASTANKDKLQAGAKIQGVAYRKFEDADRFDGKASVYSIPYDEQEYYYVDFFESGSVSFEVAGATEENTAVSQNVGDVTMTVADGIITVTGDKKDYAEIIIGGEGIPDVPDIPDIPDVPDTPDVPEEDPDVTVTTDENGTHVTYRLNNIPESEGAVLIAALVSTATGDVKEINWAACEDLASLPGDPKEISVSLTGTENDTVKLRCYICDSLGNLRSLKDYAPAEPDLKTVTAEIDTADVAWAAPDDDYDTSSELRYNIYDDGLLINEEPISGLSYSAQNLLPGADYHFTVKALDSRNNESNVSNMIKGSTYMPSTITTRIKPKEDDEAAGTPSKDGNLVYGALPSVNDFSYFYYKQDKTGGLNCLSSTAFYQSTATGTPNYVRGISYLAFKLNNPVNADNVTYAYELTYYDQAEGNSTLDMSYYMTRGSGYANRIRLTNDNAWKTVKGTFTAAKPLAQQGDKSIPGSQILFMNSGSWNSDWEEDRNTAGLTKEHLYDGNYTKIYRLTLIPLVDGTDETYNNYKKLAGASLTIENPAPGEAATIISGLDSNAKGFNSDSEDKKLIQKDGRLAVALKDLNDSFKFTVTDEAVSGKAGNIEICCFAEKETTVRLSDGSLKTIPANTWTKIRFAQSSVSDSEYSITADNDLYVSSLRVTAN